MAVLSQKTTSGERSWVKYVERNPKWQDLELAIENKMSTNLFDNELNPLLELKAGDKIKPIKKTTKKIGRLEYAHVKYKNKIGLVPINKIRKPSNTNVLKEEAIALNKLNDKIKELIKSVGPIDNINIIIKDDPKKKCVQKYCMC